MNSISRTLPDFAKPPVIETVLDVSFSSLRQWGIPHFGLFWQSIRDEYPTFKDQPPIILQREHYGEQPGQPLTRAVEEVMNQIVNQELQPKARCWFEDPTGARLIQVQNDRFVHNWRKTESDHDYPHYEQVIRPAFEREWKRFCAFLEQEKIELPDVQQLEVQYINHVDLSGWNSFADLVDGLADWPGGRGEKFLPVPENAALNVSYLMPKNTGRLRIIMQPAIRRSDGMPVIQLNLLARGRPASSSTEDILRWFDLGREWIVRGFTDFTSEGMHQIWERIA